MPNTNKTIPSWFLLNNVEPGNRERRILGAVVPEKNRAAPFTEYRPNIKAMTDDDRKPIEALWAPIWDDDTDVVELTNYIEIQNRLQEGNTDFSVQSVLQAFARNRVGKKVEIVAGQVKRYTIDNAGAMMPDKYVPCRPWFNEVKKLCNNKQLYFVTGVQVCWNLTVRYDREKDVGIGIQAGVPNQAVGNPIPGQAFGVKGGYATQTTEKVEQTFAEKVVIAVRYNILTPVYPERSRRFLLPFFGSNPPPEVLGFDVGGFVKGNMKSYASGSSQHIKGTDYYTLHPFYVEARDDEDEIQAHPNGALTG